MPWAVTRSATSTPARLKTGVLTTLQTIMTDRIALCQEEGFDAIEADNVDAYSDGNIGDFTLSMAQEETYIDELVAIAHSDGLAFFLKNELNGDSLITTEAPLVDGEIDEQCWQYSECSPLDVFVQEGKPVLNIEYQDFAESTLCSEANAFPMATIQAGVDLTGPLNYGCWQYGGGTSTSSATSTTGATSTTTHPAITSATSATARVGSSFHLTVKATGNPIPVVAESGKLPKGLRWTENGNGTATLAGTPRAYQGGLYHLRFVASSSIGTVTEAFRLTVAQAPAVTSASSAKAVRDHVFRFTFKSTGYPMATITRTGSIRGMTFTTKSNGTATLSGRPTKAGTYRLTITAKNSVGSASHTFTLTVSKP
jgi:hypothetical protein